MELILEEQNPEFPRYNATKDDEFRIWLNLKVDELSKKIVADRLQINSLITRLSSEQIELRGKHPVLGWLNISEWTSFFLSHEAHHLYTIFWLEKTINSDGGN